MLKPTTLVAVALLSLSAHAADFHCKNTGAELAARPQLLHSETRYPGQPARPADGLLAGSALPAPALLAQLRSVAPSPGVLGIRAVSAPGMPAMRRTTAGFPAADRALALAFDASPREHATLLEALREKLRLTPPGMTPSWEYKLWLEALAARHRNKPGRDGIDKHTQPKNDLEKDYAKRPRKPAPGSPMAALADAAAASACTGEVTERWGEAELALDVATGGAIYGAVESMLANPAQYRHHNPTLFPLVEEYVAQARNLLKACYIPAEKSPFVKRHSLLSQLGTLSMAGAPFCTAMAFGAADYVLTARHCFANVTSRSAPVWFVPASGQHRYEVCAIEGADALDEEQFRDINRDQVMVRVASGGAAPAKLAFLASGKMLSIEDYDQQVNKAPTLLRDVSFFPLANLVLPSTYPSGFVQGAVGVCAASAKFNGCFSHTCSAISGGSGSPVFVASDEQLILAGTHVGLSNSVGLECKSPAGAYYNSAVYIDPRFGGLAFSKNLTTNP